MTNVRNRRKPKPSVVGSGLVALDIIIPDDPSGTIHLWAGGTCGNVLAALSFLGWKAAPVSRLRPGDAATQLLNDLKACGVSADHLTLSEDGSTPIIVQHIRQTAEGTPYHKFSWRCPECGGHLPAYKPVLASAAADLAENIGHPNAFFFDRVSRGTLILAKACAERGALVMFEPSGVGNVRLFREAWSLAHIVKYSHERLSQLPETGVRNGPQLQIETLGQDGLRYRAVRSRQRSRRWNVMPAFRSKPFKDAAGAGDWCTAGLLHRLGAGGLPGFAEASDDAVRQAVQYGQALAAWNCSFKGARGGMYEVDKPTFTACVQRILDGDVACHPEGRDVESAYHGTLRCLCPSCQRAFAKARSKQR